MKDLLEKWSRLEPTICKRETRPNVDWHEEFEDYYIKAEIGWQVVYFDGYGRILEEVKHEAPARIQWAIQQAIVQKGWYFLIRYNNQSYRVEVGKQQPSICYHDGDNLVELLLIAYLKVLEDNRA